MENKSENSQKSICEEISKGNFELYKSYSDYDVRCNILGNSSNIGKEQVLEVLKMWQFESFPVTTIKNEISEDNIVVIESTGVATTKNWESL